MFQFLCLVILTSYMCVIYLCIYIVYIDYLLVDECNPPTGVVIYGEVYYKTQIAIHITLNNSQSPGGHES